MATATAPNRPKKRAPRKEPAAMRGTRRRRRGFKRRRSALAEAALIAFLRLRSYFSHDAQLAEALEWDEATVASWRDREVVRPQRAKVSQIGLFLDLCEDVRPFLDRNRDVGGWVTTALPNLHGASPARVLNRTGTRGLAALRSTLVDTVPRLTAGELEPIDEAESNIAPLDGADDHAVDAFHRMLADVS